MIDYSKAGSAIGASHSPILSTGYVMFATKANGVSAGSACKRITVVLIDFWLLHINRPLVSNDQTTRSLQTLDLQLQMNQESQVQSHHTPVLVQAMTTCQSTSIAICVTTLYFRHRHATIAHFTSRITTSAALVMLHIWLIYG